MTEAGTGGLRGAHPPSHPLVHEGRKEGLLGEGKSRQWKEEVLEGQLLPVGWVGEENPSLFQESRQKMSRPPLRPPPGKASTERGLAGTGARILPPGVSLSN